MFVASTLSDQRICIVGLGYVGLPLAAEFAKRHRVIGFDIDTSKIEELRSGFDRMREVPQETLRALSIDYTSDAARIRDAEFVIVCVPTPIDPHNNPDLSLVTEATATVGRHLGRGATVIFESTVFPGVTEDVCLPILEHESGMHCPADFKIGYSPERVNPGDKEHTIPRIVKIVSGCDAETTERVAGLYSSIVEAGVHRASSIKVAEAAKVIENTQRDLNIALMNELAILFDRIGIDTMEVLQAAGTKWNFLPFRPGLVGGHCIGVDPYYLTHKADMLGYHPQVILAGRRINDGMGKFIAEQTVKHMIRNGSQVKGAKVNVLGLTFKEDCPDIRNTRVIDVVHELQAYGIDVHVHDPVTDAADARHEYGIELAAWDALPRAAALIVAVAHREFVTRPVGDFLAKVAEGGCFIDVKSRFDLAALQRSGLTVWRL